MDLTPYKCQIWQTHCCLFTNPGSVVSGETEIKTLLPPSVMHVHYILSRVQEVTFMTARSEDPPRTFGSALCGYGPLTTALGGIWAACCPRSAAASVSPTASGSAGLLWQSTAPPSVRVACSSHCRSCQDKSRVYFHTSPLSDSRPVCKKQQGTEDDFSCAV